MDAATARHVASSRQTGRSRKHAALWQATAFLMLLIVTFLPFSAGQTAACKSKSAAQVLASSREMIDSGAFDSALQCLPRAVRPKMPDSVFFDVKSMECEAHMMMGANAAALSACFQALEKRPSDSLTNLRLGNLHSSAGNNSGAMPFFQAAIQTRPDSPIPRNNLALALQALGRKDEAIQVFEDALVQTEPSAHGRSLVLTNLAVALDSSAVERKMDLLEEAYAIDALDETAINIAGTMCNDRNSDKEKCEGCRVLLQHHMTRFADRGTPFHPGIYRTLAVCLSMLGMGRDATDVLQRSGSLTGEATVSAAQYGSLDQVFEAANGSMENLAVGIMTFGATLARQSLFEKDPKKFIFHSIRACFAGLRINPDVPTLRLRFDCAQRLFHAAAYRQAERMYTIGLLRRYGTTGETLMQHSVHLAAEAFNGIGASIEMQHERLDVSAFAYGQSVKLAPEYHTAFFSYAHIKVRARRFPAVVPSAFLTSPPAGAPLRLEESHPRVPVDGKIDTRQRRQRGWPHIRPSLPNRPVQRHQSRSRPLSLLCPKPSGRGSGSFFPEVSPAETQYFFCAGKRCRAAHRVPVGGFQHAARWQAGAVASAAHEFLRRENFSLEPRTLGRQQRHVDRHPGCFHCRDGQGLESFPNSQCNQCR
jgi:Flp pilus assembly protein TadD